MGALQVVTVLLRQLLQSRAALLAAEVTHANARLPCRGGECKELGRGGSTSRKRISTAIFRAVDILSTTRQCQPSRLSVMILVAFGRSHVGAAERWGDRLRPPRQPLIEHADRPVPPNSRSG